MIPPVSEFESPKLKIAGNSQLFKANIGGFKIVNKAKKTRQKEERFVMDKLVVEKSSRRNFETREVAREGIMSMVFI